MRVACINPQGNFDPRDSYWTEHSDFGGQLVYVKELSLALADLGHTVDIVTRRMIDPRWPEFAAPRDGYPGHPNVRIVRIPFGGDRFLPKEELWPALGAEFVPGIATFYGQEGTTPDAVAAHYGDGGISAVLLRQQIGTPFTFTAHSLGAQKMDDLHPSPANLADLDARFHFARRLAAERVSVSHASVNIVSTRQERDEQYAHIAYRGAIDVRDDSRFAVIPPGVNLRVFDRRLKNQVEDAIRVRVDEMFARDLQPQRRGLPAIVSSSRLERKKNHIGLVRAFAASPELQAQANLVIIARGSDNPLHDRSGLAPDERAILDEITAIVDDRALWGKVSAFPLNGQEELAAAYRYLAARRSVFALTALYEPFGLAPLEAIAAGLPAVVTKNGGPSESLRNTSSGDEYGVLVDPANPVDIARGLLELVSSSNEWLRYRDAGIQRVAENYTWQRAAERYVSVLERIQRGKEKDAKRSMIPIPDYFQHPSPATDPTVDELARLYFGADNATAAFGADGPQAKAVS